MIVRPLVRADTSAFRQIRLECLRLHPSSFGSTLDDWQNKTDDQYGDRIEDGVIFGLFTDDGLQGIMAYDREKGGNTRHRAGIHAVYVRDPLRGSGAVDLLLDHLVARARADGVTQLELSVSEDNPRAMAVYVRNGFAAFAATPRALLVQGHYLSETHMMLRLDISAT